MNRKRMLATCILVAGLAIVIVVNADQPGGGGRTKNVPQIIPYHGILEKDGALVNAIGADTVAFRVSLWDDPAAGAKVWPAAADTYDEHEVNVYDGRFAFDIGSTATYVHVPDTSLYLDIQVMGPGDVDFVQLGGRQRFLSAPFAVAAQRSDTDFLIDGRGDVSGDLAVAGSADLQTATVQDDLTVAQGDLVVESGALLLGEACTTYYDLGGFCTGDMTRKPFMWRTYSIGNPWNLPGYDTEVGVDEWVPSLSDFAAFGGDINENGAVNPIYVDFHSRVGVGNSWNWHIRADFATHNSSESWIVHVLFVRKNLVEL